MGKSPLGVTPVRFGMWLSGFDGEVNPVRLASLVFGIVPLLVLPAAGCNTSSVPDNGKPTYLTGDISVQLRHGSRLRLIQTSSNGPIIVQLHGMCRFRVAASRLVAFDAQHLIVETRGASIATAYAEFQVSAWSDTTEVSVSHMPSDRSSDVTVTARAGLAQPIHLHEGMVLHLP